MSTNPPGGIDPGFSSPAPSDSSSTDAKEKAQQAAGTAADEAKSVAGTAQSEAGQVAQEAKSQVHGLLDQAAGQADDQARTQRDRLVGTLGSLGDDLKGMSAQGGDGLAADLTREVADRVHGLSSHLDGREPRELLDDVRDFARRRPGTFLLGALAAGVVVGRLTRGAKDADSGSHGSTTSIPAEQPVTPTMPPASPASATTTFPPEPYAPVDTLSSRGGTAGEVGPTTTGGPASCPGAWTDTGIRGDQP